MIFTYRESDEVFMKYKNIVIKALLILIVLFINIGALDSIYNNKNQQIEINYRTLSDRTDNYKVYYSETSAYGEENSIGKDYIYVNKEQDMQFSIPDACKFIRIDLGENSGNIWLKDLQIKYGYKKVFVDNEKIAKFDKSDSIYQIDSNQDWLTISAMQEDPYFIINLSQILDISNVKIVNTIIRVSILMLFNIAIIIVAIFRKKIKNAIIEIYNNKNLIWNLSVNDFKTKYAGSYLGIFWAFVQPVVTTLIYWFVFDFGFKAAPASSDTPFILWLIAGIVPWFFFSESVMNATNSLLEYSYLVKKVLFKISILPVIKIISSFFIHVFFIFVVGVVFISYSHIPSIYIIQLLYYVTCTAVLALAISYITSAVIVFFKDLGQIINVVLQIGMWLTPIMWNQNMLSEKYHWILKLNPIYYIVEGYRDCFINKIWFWEKYMQTTYFWIVVLVIFSIGIIIFKKLKNHFADVL